MARRWKAELSHAAGDWLDDLAGRFTEDLEREFSGIRLAKDLGRRWPQEYERLAARVEDGRNRVERLRQLASDLKAKPLEHLSDVQTGLQDLETLRREIGTVREDAERLQKQLLADRDAVRQAAREDLAKIRQKLQMPKLDEQQLTEYLLGEELLAKLHQVEEWLERGQMLARYIAARPDINHERGRGTDVLFGCGKRGPDFLIRSVSVSGSGFWNDQPVQFRGRLQGLTHQPQRWGQPARIQLATQGGLELQLDSLVDLTHQVPRSRFVVNCPSISQPRRVFGNADRLAMSMSSGGAHLWAQLEFVGDAMTGDIRWRQDQVQLEPAVSAGCGGRRLQVRLAEALAEINCVQASVSLAGNFTDPQCRIQSNLGPLVVRGLQTAVQHELQALAEELAAKADAALQTELAKLDGMLQGQRDKLLARLSDEERKIEAVKQELVANMGLPSQLKLPSQLPLPNGWTQPPVRVGSLLGR